eukprot:768014-Prorocentrum_minimum.AAC.1
MEVSPGCWVPQERDDSIIGILGGKQRTSKGTTGAMEDRRGIQGATGAWQGRCRWIKVYSTSGTETVRPTRQLTTALKGVGKGDI